MPVTPRVPQVCTRCEYACASPVTPVDTSQDVLTPGQKGHVTVTVTNSDAAKGLRLIDPVYYFEVDDGDVLKLIAPSGGLVYVSFGDKELTNRLADQATPD